MESCGHLTHKGGRKSQLVETNLLGDLFHVIMVDFIRCLKLNGGAYKIEALTFLGGYKKGTCTNRCT